MVPAANRNALTLPFDSAPETPEALRRWIIARTGVQLSARPVCPEHTTPWNYFQDLYFRRPSLALVLASRGAGKSFLSALHTHLVSRWNPGHATRVLGGSQAQSLQVYNALADLVQRGQGIGGNDADAVLDILKGEARYHNGSHVAILAASSKSVRGPHVPSLKLDEIDEIDPECREAAMGMCMERQGSAGSVIMTSTWHRVDGPMATMMDQARAGSFPLYTFCAFDVLAHCDDDRSGPHLERCGECPLREYCHDVADGGPPKAKRAAGHYAIDSLIQKLRSTSARTFQAEYLCLGPRTDGLWFPNFSPSAHVSPLAEYDPALPVNVAIDSGVFTGAVLFQVVRPRTAGEDTEAIHVFADYLTEGLSAETNARAILEVARKHCQGRIDLASTDPAGGSRNAVGPTVIAEYERVGLRPLHRWPLGPVADGLALVESFLHPADGPTRLFLHPRCTATVRALGAYRRARRGGHWQDYPEDPQHPHEDLVDALRGGLRTCFPEGRTTRTNYTRISARRLF